MIFKPLKLVVVAVLSLMLALGLILFLTKESSDVGADTSENFPMQSAGREPVGVVPLPKFDKKDQEQENVSPPDWRKKGALAGEQTVTFSNAEEMANFIKRAEEAGLSILGVIDQFYTVRVGGDYNAILAQLGENGKIGYNYPVDVPALPDANFWAGSGVPFYGGAVEFMGVKNVNTISGWGNGVKIAVLDTGWKGHSSVPNDNIQTLDLVQSGTNEGELSSHGTAVIGLIKGKSPYVNGLSQSSDLLSIRVLDGNGSGDSFTLAKGIVEAVNAGANVINMSLGTYYPNEILEQAISFANSRGVILVAAAGNDGKGVVSYPAAYDGVIAVASVDAAGDRAGFSNFGETVDIAAPGRELYAAWADDGYVYFDGTSGSTALVSGVAALAIEKGWVSNGSEFNTLIHAQANDTGPPGVDSQYGAGLLNIGRLEDMDTPGIVDLALGDLYPAIEESNGSSFPLYISFQNRGTTFIGSSEVKLEVNGSPYYYKFAGMDIGEVKSVQIPIAESQLAQGAKIVVKAQGELSGGVADARPENDAGTITLEQKPGE